MFSKSSDFSYEVDPTFDFTLDEKGNKFMALRKIKWGSSEEYKLDLRNYVATEEGERMLKGCTFISDEGAHELTSILIEQGYGHADTIADKISESREDIMASMVSKVMDMDKDEIDHYLSLKSSDVFYDLTEVA